MGLFAQGKMNGSVEMPVTVIEETDQYPALVIYCKSLPEKKYEALATEWTTRDQKNPVDAGKLADLYWKNILVLEGDGDNKKAKMTGFTLPMAYFFLPTYAPEAVDLLKFEKSGEAGIQFDRESFLEICRAALMRFATPMVTAYKAALENLSRDKAKEELAKRKNFENGHNSSSELAA